MKTHYNKYDSNPIKLGIGNASLQNHEKAIAEALLDGRAIIEEMTIDVERNYATYSKQYDFTPTMRNVGSEEVSVEMKVRFLAPIELNEIGPKKALFELRPRKDRLKRKVVLQEYSSSEE